MVGINLLSIRVR